MQPSQRQPHQPVNSFLAELRRNPFRPVRPEELCLLEPRRYEVPLSIPISRGGYRKFYEHAFAFTAADERLLLTLLEVGFWPQSSGSILLTGAFQAHEKVVKKILDLGFARLLHEACRLWRERADIQGFDPNDIKRQFAIAWPGPPTEERLIAISNSLTPEERRAIGSHAVWMFLYDEGLPKSRTVPGEIDTVGITAAHSHSITHNSTGSFFPSEFDKGSPVLWIVVDIEFIRQTLDNNFLHPEEKIRKIIEHHVDGMEQADCIGTSTMNGKEITPLIRAR